MVAAVAEGSGEPPSLPEQTKQVRKRTTSPNLSLALDAARAAAALYVIAHHVANAHEWSKGIGVLLRFGQEAVLVFFLLSGFVIFANERTRALHPRGYYLRRLRRIYPPLLVAMLVSALVTLSMGQWTELFHWRDLVANLLSLQDISFLKPGVIAEPFLNNNPLWSLSYEVFFYLIFPPILMAWTRRKQLTEHAVGLGCCLLYLGFSYKPNHFLLVGAYFLVWWCGAMAADAYAAGARTFVEGGGCAARISGSWCSA